MKGVVALPCSRISSMRFSAIQEDPFERSVLETVPEPIMVPAPKFRVLAAWAIKVGKSNVISTPAFGQPNNFLFRCVINGKFTFLPSHALPNSSGVTATGEKAEEGLL